MIPVENLVYDLIPNIAVSYPLVSTFIHNDTPLHTLVNNYIKWIQSLPSNNVKQAVHEFQSIIEKCLNTLNFKYRYKEVLYTLKGAINVNLRTYTVIRGTEFVVPNDLTTEDDAIVIATRHLQLLKSAYSRGLSFNLTHSDVRKLLKRKTCYYLGKPFEEEGDFVLTVDRLDCNKGYVKGNVVACSHLANQMKAHFFEHNGYSQGNIDKLFFKWFTLIAEGKVIPKY